MKLTSLKLKKKSHEALRLGLYGGTFDPVHHGHLIRASDAQEELGLDYLFWIPCACSPHKEEERMISRPEDRAAMLDLALKGKSSFLLSTIEIERGGPSYSIETAREFRSFFPRSEFFWLIGADQVAGLSTWKEIQALQSLVTFVVMDRGNKLKSLPEGILSLKHSRRIDISATEIRQRVRQKLSIEHLVPSSVCSYIHRTLLYQPYSL